MTCKLRRLDVGNGDNGKNMVNRHGLNPSPLAVRRTDSAEPVGAAPLSSK